MKAWIVRFVFPVICVSMASAQVERGGSRVEASGFEIPKQATNAILVMRRDDGGQGTGFIVKRQMDGKYRYFVYTNQHVLAGSKNLPKAYRADGTEVALGKLVTAVNYDLAIFLLAAAEPNFLELESNVDQSVPVGEMIGTPGNAGGAATIGYRFGRVVAIGPELVEIDAPIKGGNSGGPILLKNGRVIGIVSFFKQETVDDPRLAGAGQQMIVRRFGYRVDNVKSWETPDWKRFVEQGERVARVEATSRDLLVLVESRFSSWNGNEQIGRIMGSFQKNVDAARSQKEANGDISKVFTDLKQVALADLNAALSDRSLYWWWKHTLEDHKSLRSNLDKAFEKQAAEAKQKR